MPAPTNVNTDHVHNFKFRYNEPPHMSRQISYVLKKFDLLLFTYFFLLYFLIFLCWLLHPILQFFSQNN